MNSNTYTVSIPAHTLRDLKASRKLARERDLARRQEVGEPRAKCWGGKDKARTERRKTKNAMRMEWC